MKNYKLRFNRIKQYLKKNSSCAIQVPVYNNTDLELPKYQTKEAAGMDLKATISASIPSGGFQLIPTGLHIKLPKGYEAQVRPRSGLALKYGITVCNSPGTIDGDYTGEIGVILINHGPNAFSIKPGDRIAQLVLNKVETISWLPVSSHTDLEVTERAQDGFGSTGV